ncbi:hypothetical protein ACF0H5_000725 [Mactra antiquata]
MNLGRSDTYINVYLPREDGEDPRLYTKPMSPVYDSGEVYKFSDQIVKDRKLFIGRKQMSLYDIYYKNDKEGGENTPGSPANAEEPEEVDQEFDIEPPPENKEIPIYRPTKISKVSISLRRAEKIKAPRFNEPLTLYNSGKGHTPSIHDKAGNIDKQTFDIVHNSSRRRRATTGNKGNSSTSRTYTISKLFKKIQSAPSEFRSLGLPPISRSSTALTAIQPDYSYDKQRAFVGTRGQPLRPSSKPNKIWNKSNSAYDRGYTSTSLIENATRSGHMTSSRTRLSANLTSVSFV